MEFDRYFDGIFCSSEMRVKKPENEFYNQILSKLRIENSSEVLYFDDSEENIRVAQSL
jgi:HAD superfamily hydrolase (TIGR01509 family)